MADKVDDILIELEAETSGADESLEKLANSLSKIKTAVNNIKPEKLTALTTAINSLNVSGDVATAIETVATSLSRLARSVKDVSLSKVISETKSLYSIGDVNGNVETLTENLSSLSDTTKKQETVNSGALRQIVDAINGINVSPQTGETLKNIGNGYRSIAQSVNSLNKIEPDKLREIVDVVSNVNSSLGNLGSNNKISIKFDAEGIKKTVQPVHEIATDIKKVKDEGDNLTGTSEELQRAIETLGVDSTQTGSRLAELADEIKNIQLVLKAFKAGTIKLNDKTVVEYTTKLKQLTDEYKRLSQNSQSAANFEMVTSKLSSVFGKISQGAKVASGFFKMLHDRSMRLFKILITPIKLFGGKLIGDVQKLGKAFTSMSSKAQESLKKMTAFWTRAMRTFTFMLVRRAITAVLQDLDTAKQSLALWSDYVGTKFNDSVSNINADCMWIAKSIVAAFEPLINAVVPILDFVAEKISGLLAKVGEFFAALTGQSYFVKAKKNVVDYAKSLDKAKKSAKNGLQSFDEINNITTQKNKDIDSPLNTFKDDWEKSPVSEGMKNLADKIKQIAADLWYPIGKAWDAMKDYVIAGWKYMTDEIKSLAKDMWADFIDVWKSDETVEIFKNIFGIVGDIEFVIGNLVHNFHEAWNDGKVGKKIFENIRDIIGIIVQHVRNVTLYMKDWSKSINFHPILQSVERLTDSFKRVADFIGSEFEDVMKLGVLKFTKWLIEKGLPDINHAFANVFDAFDFDKIRKDLKPVISALEYLAENVVGGVTKAFEYLGKKAAEFFNSKDFTKMAKNFSKILGVFTSDRIATVLEGIGKAFMDIAEALAKIVLSDAAVKVFEFIGNMIDMKGVDGIARDIKKLVANIALFGGLAGTALIISKIAGVFSGLFNAISMVSKLNTLDKLTKALSGMSGVGQAADGIEKVGKAAEGLGESANKVSLFAKALDGIKSFGLGADAGLKGLFGGGDIGMLVTDIATEGGKAAGAGGAIATAGASIAAGLAAAIAGYEGGKWGAYALAKVFGDDQMAEVYKNFDITKDLASWMDVDTTPLENLKDAIAGIKLMFEDLPNNKVLSTLVSVFAPIINGITLLGNAAKMHFENISSAIELAKGKFDEIKAKVEEFKTSAITNISQFAIDVGLKFTEIGVRISEWYNNEVAPWFTLDRWVQLTNNIGTALVQSVNSMIEQWSALISTWWTTFVEPYFDLAKWTGLLDVVPQSFKDAFKAAANAAISALNKIIEGLETMLNGGMGEMLGKIAEKASQLGFDIQLDFGEIKLPRIPTFATGGFPEDGIFAANHNELVGQFNNGKTAVANNSQIIAGIEGGVAQANQQQNILFSQMIDLLGVIAEKDLTIGDDVVYNSYTRGAARYSKRYGI